MAHHSKKPHVKRPSLPSTIPLAFVCSPYSGDVKKNLARCKRYCRLLLELKRVPFAPHLLFPQFLKDDKPSERDAGMSCGKMILRHCDMMYVFAENGISAGMVEEIEFAKTVGVPLIYSSEASLKEDAKKGEVLDALDKSVCSLPDPCNRCFKRNKCYRNGDTCERKTAFVAELNRRGYVVRESDVAASGERGTFEDGGSEEEGGGEEG